MGLLDFLSPALTTATQAYGTQQNAEAQGKKDDIGSALQMLKMKRDQEKASLDAANTQSEMAHRTAEDAGKGVFQGRVRPQSEMASFDQDAAKIMDTGLSGAPNAYEDMKAADPERNAPDRFQQVGPNQTLDKYQAPEAVQSRKLTAQDELRSKRDAQTQAAAERRQQLHEQFMSGENDKKLQAMSDRLGNKAEANVIQSGIDPVTHQLHVYRIPKVSGPATEVEGIAPKPSGTGGMGASLAPEDRQKMLAQAKLDNETMKEFEAKVLAGKASVGMASGIAGAMGGAHGAGVMPGVLAAVGNTATGNINPEYQRYITAQRSYGRIMGNLQSKRYSDNQAEIERSISGLGANDLNPTIEYKQRLRDASLADPQVSGASSADGAAQAHLSPAGGASHAQALWDAAVAKHGQAKVLSEYGPRPAQ